MDRLEEAVDVMVARVSDLQRRLRKAQARNDEMRELLRQFTEGEEDPGELEDVFGALGAERAGWQDQLRAIGERTKLGQALDVERDPETLEMLRGLGYLGE